MLWRYLLRPILFSIPAERAHYAAMSAFRYSAMLPGVASFLRNKNKVSDSRLASEHFGLKFENPVGLAAGFDKNGQWFELLELMGFSHIEIGTLTAHAQPGNDKPRLFRLPQDRALINRMGFNNDGSEAAAQALQGRTCHGVLGINIGKSKITELADAASDYAKSMERLIPYAGYFTINVSSPNTPGLRKLQNRDDLEQIIRKLKNVNRSWTDSNAQKAKPILLKIAPDLTLEQIDEIADLAIDSELDGLIATNTTIAREPLQTDTSVVEQIGAGGLSGKPLTERSREVVRRLFLRLQGKIPVIGCGGIMSADDAWQMICSGASMVQVYTGFVYGGPQFVRQLNRELLKKLDERGINHIQDAIGIDA